MATEEGRKLLATNPDKINVAVLMKHSSFREFYKSEREPAADMRMPCSTERPLNPGR